jgi:hypothetical protein
MEVTQKLRRFRNCALAMMLITGAVVFASPAMADADLLQYPQTSLTGVITAETFLSAEKCRQLCEARTGCAGYDHTAAANACRMFGNVSGAKKDTGSTAAARKTIAGYSAPSNDVTGASPDTSSEWGHNGSVMRLRHQSIADGSTDVEIVYDRPKIELQKIGIRPGSILFKGKLSGGTLSGRARLTSNRCGLIEYDVEGLFDPASKVPLLLHGAAPKRGNDCTIERWVETGGNADLRFDPW